jgi:subtilisin family serine protease
MKAKIFFTVAALFVSLTVFTFWQMSAQMQSRPSNDQSDAQKINPDQADFHEINDEAKLLNFPDDDFKKLLEKTTRNGSIRVIVELRAGFQPEGALRSPFAQKTQRAGIKRAQDNLLAELNGYRLDGIKRFDFIPFIAAAADAAALLKMRASPLVASIREDRLVKPSITESVPVVGAPGGIANGFSGSGQTIAVLDTGVDKNHDYFAGGKVVSEACFSTNMGTNPDFDSSVSLCPGGAPESTAPDSGLNCDTSQIGVCWHGTHVAGIAAGRDVGRGHFGVAKDASIIAVQVFSKFNNPGNCNGFPPCINSYNSDIIKGLERVYALRATFNIASVNMSFGDGNFSNYCDGEDAAMKAAIDNLRSVNIASTIASGNNGSTSTINFPACISSAISVGSTADGSNFTTQDTISNFSNTAQILNFYAPGISIISASPGNQLRSSAGTSMAAPHVAGAWAILKQQNPVASVSQILTALSSTGKIITDPRAGAGSRKTPRIRVDAASQQLAGTNCVRTGIAYNQFVNAALDVADCALETGVNRDLYSFNGTAGDRVAILMTSPDFDAFLYLLDPNGRVVAFDDNGGGGTSARIPAAGNLTLTLPGSYTILATKAGSSFAPANGNYQLNMLAPTAAGVAVGGRVTTADGFGVANAQVVMIDQSGAPRAAITGAFGFYFFENVRAGETYIFEIRHKRLTFAPRVVSVSEDLTELNFAAEP